MPSVQVKDFPQDLYDELKVFAESQHRSMAQQLVVAAEQMLRRPSVAADRAGHGDAMSSDEVGREERIAKRQALFARMDASTQRAKQLGVWRETGLRSEDFVREDRDGGGRHGGEPDRIEAERMVTL